MSGPKYEIRFTAQFKKGYKLAAKRGFNLSLLEDIISLLAAGHPLPERNRDHALSGNWSGHHECHIQPDWLLLYIIEKDTLVLTLTHTGTHSDLFDR